MSSDRLLDELTANLSPVSPRRVSRELLLLLAVGVVELGFYLLMGAARHDLSSAVRQASFWWKILGLLAVCVTATVAAVGSSDPTVSPRPGVRASVTVAAAVLGVGWIIDVAGAGSTMSMPHRLPWQHGLACVTMMTCLSIPAFVAFGMLLNRGAPTDCRGTGWAAGIAAGSWGAFVFSLACPYDDPFYLAVWFTLGCGLVALAGRLILPLFMRW